MLGYFQTFLLSLKLPDNPSEENQYTGVFDDGRTNKNPFRIVALKKTGVSLLRPVDLKNTFCLYYLLKDAHFSGCPVLLLRSGS